MAKEKVCEIWLDTETGEFQMAEPSQLPRFQDIRGMIDALSSVVGSLTRRMQFNAMLAKVEEFLAKNGPDLLRGGNGAPKIVPATQIPPRRVGL